MARLTDFDDFGRNYYEAIEMPRFAGTSRGLLPSRSTTSRIAMISTADPHRRGDRPFAVDSANHRLLPGDVRAADGMSEQATPKPPVGQAIKPDAAARAPHQTA